MEETWIRTLTTSFVFLWKTTKLDIATTLVVVHNACFSYTGRFVYQEQRSQYCRLEYRLQIQKKHVQGGGGGGGGGGESTWSGVDRSSSMVAIMYLF